MKIAVYSGSFNPLHKGHLAIMEYLTSCGGFDCVYMIVSPKNPLKEGIGVDSAAERFSAAVEAVRRHPELKVKVDDIEMTMEPPHYTVRTLDALKAREPENSFTLVIGADNLADFRRWRDYGRILEEYGVCVYPRKGFDLDADRKDLLKENPDYSIALIDAPMVNVSSTQIREGEAAGKDMSDYRI
ncbi:MAG: nicotinate (nicotinamide) nucleotide adenylyltransferase [Bacteroidales bacterium]|nr:nicotinate (nicotinamide) nucleotide adenylyltransferase [Bacteroidales bacterium]